MDKVVSEFDVHKDILTIIPKIVVLLRKRSYMTSKPLVYIHIALRSGHAIAASYFCKKDDHINIVACLLID